MADKAPQYVPSVEDYMTAFESVKPRMTIKQRKMLAIHYGWYGRIITATDLALLVNYDGPGGAKLQYGKLGSMVSNALGLGALGVITIALMVPPQKAGNQEWLWVMRDNVARALEQLGWVEGTSDLFCPNGPVGPAVYFPD